MAFSIRRLGKRFFVTINVIVCLLFIISAQLRYLNPDTFWFAGFLAIAMPYLLVLVVGFIIFWLLLHWQYIIFGLLSIIACYKQVGNLAAYNGTGFAQEKSRKNLRIMTWNVRRFQGEEGKGREEDDFVEKINAYKPDVICLQEFGIMDKPENDATDRVKQLQLAGYNHCVLSRDYSRRKFGYSNGLAIFSKHPFTSTERIPFTSSPESILRADIAYGKDTIRVFNAHLQSFKFTSDNYREIDKIQGGEDSLLAASKNIIVKMRRAFRNRGSQARQLELQIANSIHPAIICVDMNDVPNSYAYARITNKKTDAFNIMGSGIGRTFKYLLPTLRIDYIIVEKSFAVQQYTQVNNTLSDHYAVVADVGPGIE